MITLIKNGLIYDGTGTKPIKKNILIKDGRIAKIDSVFAHKTNRVIDATGSIITPGFIDVGSYADKSFSLFWDPMQKNAIGQGITTQIVGNDGVSLAPFSRRSLEFVAPNASRASIVHNWHSIKNFLNILNGKIATNIGTLVGTRTIKTMVTKNESKELNKKELKLFEQLTQKAFMEGALGISIGYTHTIHEESPYYEIKDFFRIAEKMKRICVIHPPVNNLVLAFEEIIRYASKTNANIEISHLRTFFDSSCTRKKMFDFIEKLSEKNHTNFDIFPFKETPTHAYELLPDWAFSESDGLVIEKLTAQENKAKLMRKFSAFEKFKISVDSVADPAFQFFEGKTVSSVAENAGLSFGEALLYLLKLTKLRIYFLASSNDTQMLDKLSSHDRSLFNWGRIHNPDGKTPLTFLKSVCEKNDIKLEKAIQKTTSLPAKKYGILKRGILEQGNYADILIIDDFKLKHVFVNGVHVFENKKQKKVFPGMSIKYKEV